MAETGYSRAPKVLKGAFVQLLEDIVGFLPNVITFQYNPETVSYSLTPFDPATVDQAGRGTQAPTAQPFDVPRSFDGFSLFFDATTGMDEGEIVPNTFGVEPQLAALRKLTEASRGLLGDLTASFTELVGQAQTEAQRPTVAPILLVLGRRVILPVRIKSFRVEEQFFNANLYPIRATVTLSMEVMTPDMFRCQTSKSASIAVGAYEFTRLQDDALAVLNLTALPNAIKSILPL